MDQKVGEAQGGQKSDDSDDDGREVGRLGQWISWNTITLAQSWYVVAKVLGRFTMEHFSKDFYNITPDDSGTAKLLDDTKRKQGSLLYVLVFQSHLNREMIKNGL